LVAVSEFAGPLSWIALTSAAKKSGGGDDGAFGMGFCLGLRRRLLANCDGGGSLARRGIGRPAPSSLALLTWKSIWPRAEAPRRASCLQV